MPTKYHCLSCEGQPEFLLKDELINHLTEKHGYKPGASATRKPTLFLDGEKGYHCQVAEWDFGTYKIQETWESRGQKP